MNEIEESICELPPIPHPVSAGVGIREYIKAYEYIKKKYEVMKNNMKRGAEKQSLPNYPRFTGDENEDFSHTLEVTENFMRATVLKYNDLIIDEAGIEDSSTDDGPSISEDDTSSCEMKGEDFDEIDVHSKFKILRRTRIVSICLFFTFKDLCIDVINFGKCKNRRECKSFTHSFPSALQILQTLKLHTPKQFKLAFDLVKQSKSLHNAYYQIFRNHVAQEETNT